MITISHDDNGNVIEEERDHPNGSVVSRTVTSASGDVTNTATGTVGIQSAGKVNNRHIRR